MYRKHTMKPEFIHTLCLSILWSLYYLSAWVQGYKDILPFAGVDHVDIEDMAPCSGCVVQQGIHKVAIYKDIMGGLHKYSGHFFFWFPFSSVLWNYAHVKITCRCLQLAEHQKTLEFLFQLTSIVTLNFCLSAEHFSLDDIQHCWFSPS